MEPRVCPVCGGRMADRPGPCAACLLAHLSGSLRPVKAAVGLSERLEKAALGKDRRRSFVSLRNRLRAVWAHLRHLGAVVPDESVLEALDDCELEALANYESQRLRLLLREMSAPGPRPWRVWTR